MKNRIFILNNLLIFFLLYLSYINYSSATILEKMNTEKLTNKSTHIVIGRVINIEYTKDQKTHLINTVVKLSLEKSVKGSLNKSEIDITFPGGTLDGRRLFVDGTPEFKIGERVLVFIYFNKNEQYRVVGWSQGKYTIINDQVVEKKIPLNSFVSEIKQIIK